MELSAAIENYFRLKGHSAIVRCRTEQMEMNFGVCSSGLNALTGTKFNGITAGTGISAAVPYGASHRPINRNEPVVLDYAFNLDGYHLDQTRIFIWGQPTAEIRRAYQAMHQVEQAIIAELRPGNIWSEIYFKAVKLAGELGYTQEFMGLGKGKVNFVGHGVGLELDELPLLAPKMEYQLLEGMTIAIEPKVALPAIGVIGDEDTLALTASGCEVLTQCPNQLIIIE